MYLGCFEDQAQFLNGSTIKITSHQESMISTMAPKLILERLILEKIIFGNQ